MADCDHGALSAVPPFRLTPGCQIETCEGCGQPRRIHFPPEPGDSPERSPYTYGGLTLDLEIVRMS